MQSGYEADIYTPGALLVTLIEASTGVGTVVATSVGGAFVLTGLAPGTYSVQIRAGVLLLSVGRSIVEEVIHTVEVANDATTRASMGVVVTCDPALANTRAHTYPCPYPSHEAMIVLSWDATIVDHLGLGMFFALAPPGVPIPSGKCDVHSGRPACGNADWSSGSDAWNCGAPTCTDEALQELAGGYPCASRMEWARYFQPDLSALGACAQIASEWPVECGECAPVDAASATASAKSEVISVRQWVDNRACVPLLTRRIHEGSTSRLARMQARAHGISCFRLLVTRCRSHTLLLLLPPVSAQTRRLSPRASGCATATACPPITTPPSIASEAARPAADTATHVRVSASRACFGTLIRSWARSCAQRR